jgi:hypothetical protein
MSQVGAAARTEQARASGPVGHSSRADQARSGLWSSSDRTSAVLVVLARQAFPRARIDGTWAWIARDGRHASFGVIVE